jgi:excisionase family DNA binding protein
MAARPISPQQRELITVREAATRSSWSSAYLYRLVERGEIEGVKAGRSVRVYVDSLFDWIERNQVSVR